MAYSQATKDAALDQFTSNVSIEEISKNLGVPVKTLYNWKTKDDWSSYLRMGNIQIAREVEVKLYEHVQKMINSEQFANPGDVDTLAKLTKALDRLSPHRQVLASMAAILEGITNYANRAGDMDFARSWSKHLRPIAAHLKGLYAPQEAKR